MKGWRDMVANPERLKPANILVVDDSLVNLKVITDIMKLRGYKIRPAPSGKLALQGAVTEPPDLILLDINMPEMDGFEVCRELKANPNLRDIPVLFLSALDDTVDKVKAFEVGGVDYITKPFQIEEVWARVETHLKLRSLQVELEKYTKCLSDLVREQVREISDSQMATIFAMAKLAESRDPETGAHLERVQAFCRMLGVKIGERPEFATYVQEDYIESLFQASPLHDLGKISISDRILLKPTELDAYEFETIKAHTTIGARTMDAVKNHYPNNAFIDMGIDIAKYHHERWDGSGYPQGLRGEEIPFSARIMALADVYDAIRSKRCYKPALAHDKACDYIFKGSGVHFDPVVVEAFRAVNGVLNQTFEKMQ
jgi:putative two-component system response regulator